MNRLLSAFLVFLVLFFVVPIVTIDKLVTDGTYTLEDGQTLRGGLVMTAGEVTIEQGARVAGGVFKSSGVLIVNGEVAGGILSTSGNVRLGPNAVVGGHVKVMSVPFEEPEGARIEGNVTADVAGWLGGEVGAAIKLLVLASIILVRPALVGLRPIPGAPGRPLAAQPTAVLALGMLLIALGVFLPLEVFEVSVSTAEWAAVFIVPGLILFAMMLFHRAQYAGLALPASVLTVTGLILVYLAVTGRWESWAYAWALVLPMSLGVGQIIAGLCGRDRRLEYTGMRTAGIGVALFLLSAIYFEAIVGASGAIAVLIVSLLLASAGLYMLFGTGLRPGGRAAGT